MSNYKDGSISLDTKLENDTIWLTQDMIVTLFNSSKANISEHISHIFQEEELDRESTVRKFRTVRKEGSRNVSRNLEYYNLDMIIAVGYRVNSKIATKFRKWATNTLREYLKNHNDEDVRIMLDNFQLLCEEISEGLLLLYGVNLQK